MLEEELIKEKEFFEVHGVTRVEFLLNYIKERKALYENSGSLLVEAKHSTVILMEQIVKNIFKK